MFAIAFDLVVATEGAALVSCFRQDIRAFRLEHWSDFTPLVKS
jgi:virulence-associated protein VapD